MGRRVIHDQKKSHEGTQHEPKGPETDAERMMMPCLKLSLKVQTKTKTKPKPKAAT